MIQIVNYGDGLYELIGSARYDIRIDGVEAPKVAELTLNQVPKLIEEKKIVKGGVIHYLWADKIITFLEYQTVKNLRNYEDDGVEFETREDKEKWESYMTNCKPVYAEDKIEWRPLEFTVLYKQKISKEHSDYIKSSYVFPGYWDKEKIIEAICTYTPNEDKMLRGILVSKDFEEVPHNTFSDHTKGRKFDIYDGVKFSKINNTYISKYFTGGCFKPTKGSYEQCIEAYDRDVQAITNVVQMIERQFSEVPLERQALKEAIDKLDICKSTLYKISVAKSYKQDYNYVYRTLQETINNLIKL